MVLFNGDRRLSGLCSMVEMAKCCMAGGEAGVIEGTGRLFMSMNCIYEVRKTLSGFVPQLKSACHPP